jgi:hypothetical protein
MITDAKLKFWIDNNLNVLFIGLHGTGKTARVKEAFDKAGLNWLYFSASTLDPWVDFIGIPKEAQDEKGNKFIELIRPRPFAEDQVEAIFLDEFNRSPKKVRNAVMELLQFKSINGKKFKNLRIVWAAINPDDLVGDGSDETEYDVEKLDPAQKDRFEVQVDVPYKPDKGYFIKKFGEDLADDAIDWWVDLDAKAKKYVSPRRLDYALSIYVKGGDLRDVLPVTVNVSKLITELKNGSFVKLMKNIFNQGDVEEGKKFMAIRNNYDNTISKIVKSEELSDFFIPCILEEDLIQLMSTEPKVYSHVVSHFSQYDKTIKNILDANNNPKLSKKLKKEPNLNVMAQNLKKSVVNKKFGSLTFTNPQLGIKPAVQNRFTNSYSSLSGRSYTNFVNDKSNINANIQKGTSYRVGIYQKILGNITINESCPDYLNTIIILSDIISSTHAISLSQTPYKGIAELFGFAMYKAIYYSGGSETAQSILSKIQVRNGRSDKLEDFLLKNFDMYA